MKLLNQSPLLCQQEARAHEQLAWKQGDTKTAAERNYESAWKVSAWCGSFQKSEEVEQKILRRGSSGETPSGQGDRVYTERVPGHQHQAEGPVSSDLQTTQRSGDIEKNVHPHWTKANTWDIIQLNLHDV